MTGLLVKTAHKTRVTPSQLFVVFNLGNGCARSKAEEVARTQYREWLIDDHLPEGMRRFLKRALRMKAR